MDHSMPIVGDYAMLASTLKWFVGLAGPLDVASSANPYPIIKTQWNLNIRMRPTFNKSKSWHNGIVLWCCCEGRGFEPQHWRFTLCATCPVLCMPLVLIWHCPRGCCVATRYFPISTFVRPTLLNICETHTTDCAPCPDLTLSTWMLRGHTLFSYINICETHTTEHLWDPVQCLFSYWRKTLEHVFSLIRRPFCKPNIPLESTRWALWLGPIFMSIWDCKIWSIWGSIAIHDHLGFKTLHNQYD